jgi:uncharacterized membrane protein
VTDFSGLLLAALVWFSIHPGIAGSPLRAWLARRIGEKGFRAAFALLSMIALSALIWSYSRAAFYPIWFAPRLIHYLPIAVMPLAFVLLAGAFTVPNPTVVMGERALQRDDAARGALRITRHPFLWAIMLWSASHLLVNGDIASILFFGTLAATALIGTFDIDRKRARTSGVAWQKFRDVTSNVPFSAIVAGRSRLVLGELWLPLAIGAVLTAGMLHFHARWFGASPLP